LAAAGAAGVAEAALGPSFPPPSLGSELLLARVTDMVELFQRPTTLSAPPPGGT
jgi:hypothetical protein